MQWHEVSEDALMSKLESTQKGLSSNDVSTRVKRYGPNVTAQETKASAIKIFIEQFKNIIILILIGAAVISYFSGDKIIEFYVITGIVAFIILLSFFEEYKATKDMEALRKLTPKKAKAIRDGKKQEIDGETLVPGDIIVLSRGDIVPADARIIHSSNLQVDESALTGESVAVSKKAGTLPTDTPLAQRKNMVYAGGQVTNGEASCIVVATGKKTELGQIASLVGDAKEEKSPLQKRIDKLGRQFSYTVLGICLFILVLGVLRGEPFAQVLLLAVAVAVAGIPEALPATIALSLSVGMKRMAKEGAIIKQLTSVETLGTCTVVCSDKTGTLTQNKMVIEKIWAFDVEINVTGEGFEPEGLFLYEDQQINPHNHHGVRKILEIGVLCNNADLKEQEGEWSIDGEATEGALIVLAKKAGVEKEHAHKHRKRIHEHPFDADRKRMSTIHEHHEGFHITYAKGAPERLLERSTHYLDKGRIKKLTPEIKEQVLRQVEHYADKGLRVLGLGYKEHHDDSIHQIKHDVEQIENNLVFAGVVSIRDPPAPSALKAIEECKQAGVRVVMITGDNPRTASAIAAELGILEGLDKKSGKELDNLSQEELDKMANEIGTKPVKYQILTGQDLANMSDEEFMRVANDVAVYARVTPKDKLRVVNTLQKLGHIVAMTGDGVNDAPALKKADIGVAMGKRGTDVAKEASEMVITDDNFATIVTAIREGRNIYTNIRKVVYYLLSGSMSSVMLVALAAVIGVVPPLTPLMILYMNLVTSDIPALGLCMEQPNKKSMKQRPRSPKEGLLSDYLLLKISQAVPIAVLGTIILYIWETAVRGSEPAVAQTIAFATLITFQLFHVFNAKSFDESMFTKEFLKNKYFIFGWFSAVAAMLLVIYWQPMAEIFGVIPLGIEHWFIIAGVGATILLFTEIQKSVLEAEIRERESLKIHSA